MGEAKEWGKSLGRVIGDFISPGYAKRELDREFGPKTPTRDEDESSWEPESSSDDDDDD